MNCRKVTFTLPDATCPSSRAQNRVFVLGKVSSALTCCCDALVWGMELLVRFGNLGLRAFEFVAGGNLGVRAFEFVAGAVLGYLA